MDFDYGSEGLGFESLRAHSEMFEIRAVKALFSFYPKFSSICIDLLFNAFLTYFQGSNAVIMQFKPTISLYLDTRTELKNGLFRIKLRVSFFESGASDDPAYRKQTQKYYSTDYSCTPAQWEKINSKTVPPSLRQMREDVLKFEAHAKKIISDRKKITIEQFDNLISGRYSGKAGVSMLFNEVISKMTGEGRISTASAYRCALKSLILQCGEFTLEEVTISFLEKYERKMIDAGESATTVGFYLRALRAIFNIAVNEKMIVDRGLYPFGVGKYKIPKGSNIKKALKKPDKVKLEKQKPKDEREKRALAFWMFSYYCNGANFTDLAYLKPSDIHDDFITYVRRKTMRTVRQVKPIVVPIRPEMRRILKQYGTGKEFCFGIITEEMTPEQRYRKIQDWIKLTNKYVNEVAGRLGLGKVNTYSARHTFATMLLKGNANLKAIQQSLGHRSISTTEAYLADLDIEEAKKMSKLL